MAMAAAAAAAAPVHARVSYSFGRTVCLGCDVASHTIPSILESHVAPSLVFAAVSNTSISQSVSQPVDL